MVSLVLLYLTTIGMRKYSAFSDNNSILPYNFSFLVLNYHILILYNFSKLSWKFYDAKLFPVYFAPYIEQESGGLDVWYKTEPWLCHSMLATLMFCFQSPIFWMFIEGIYLHAKVSTNIFNQPPPFSIYYFIGWGESETWERSSFILIGGKNYNLTFSHLQDFPYWSPWSGSSPWSWLTREPAGMIIQRTTPSTSLWFPSSPFWWWDTHFPRVEDCVFLSD